MRAKKLSVKPKRVVKIGLPNRVVKISLLGLKIVVLNQKSGMNTSILGLYIILFILALSRQCSFVTDKLYKLYISYTNNFFLSKGRIFRLGYRGALKTENSMKSL